MTYIPHLFILLLLSAAFIGFSQCHCPHMMGIKPPGPPSGPSAPGKIPDGDEGWDYDETAAPGIVPEPHFIQSTYVYRSHNVQEKSFSTRVVNVLKDIRERLAKSARLTLENENIECSSPTDHYRCQEYPTSGSWNYLIVEDQSHGAVTYTFDRKFNEKNDGTIEMALLDAYSRHSPSSLIAFASPEAEKEVGYIRALTTQELNSLGPKRHHPISLEKFGPNELNLIEPALLEVRTGVNLKTESESLKKIESSQEFDKLLDEYKNVFVLFWNSNRMVSLHTFNLFSQLGEKLAPTLSKDTLLAHVPCQENADFCHGLSAEDFNTVVAYKNGQNVGKTENIGDVEFYENWVELILAGPLQKIGENQLGQVKKGKILGKKRSAVTIGIFPSEQDTSFQHFQIAAEKLAGKYYVAYQIVADSTPTVSTYRSAEKQKRTDYSGRFDPSTLMEFITKSALPNVLDISNGFTTTQLLRQKRPILILIGSETSEPFAKLAARKDARSSYIFAEITRKNVQKTLEGLGVGENENAIVLVNKDRIHKIAASVPKCPDHLQKLLQVFSTSEPNKVLSTKEPHPLRYLQVEKVNDIFGFEETIVLPDHTLFLDSDPFARHPPIGEDGGTGGCPFMQGGGHSASSADLGGAGDTKIHEEL